MLDHCRPPDFERPHRVEAVHGDQLSLFPELTAKTLANARVSYDEAERWRDLGWVSSDVAAFEQLLDNQVAELIFVRNIARSGLTDAQINALFAELPRPYEYRSDHTAYCFAIGWCISAPSTSTPLCGTTSSTG